MGGGYILFTLKFAVLFVRCLFVYLFGICARLHSKVDFCVV